MYTQNYCDIHDNGYTIIDQFNPTKRFIVTRHACGHYTVQQTVSGFPTSKVKRMRVADIDKLGCATITNTIEKRIERLKRWGNEWSRKAYTESDPKLAALYGGFAQSNFTKAEKLRTTGRIYNFK